jgi:para-aminobenzoate synthetase/4-amino-4-deoxychorismate lyase
VFSPADFKRTLSGVSRKNPRGEFKVRVILSQSGKISVKTLRLLSMTDGKIAISNLKMDSSNIYLYHKTENRKFYDSDFNKYAKKGFADVIYLNENNEVTEAHSSNIFAEIKGVFYTPPVSCGLLPGTFREYLLKKNPSLYKERVLHTVDLINADNLYLVNSVRGFRKVTLI